VLIPVPDTYSETRVFLKVKPWAVFGPQRGA